MRIPRKSKTVCAALGTVFLLFIFLMTRSTVLNEQTRISTTSPLQWFIPQSETAEKLTEQLKVPEKLTQEHSDDEPYRRKCVPTMNVAFVKTHKAGSSTVANILQRFGISHNLSFALPNTKIHSYGYNYISRPGGVLTPSKLRPLPNGSQSGYNILCNHAIYNKTAFRMFMAPNTAYISILREPFQQFVSAFEYYDLKKMVAKRDPFVFQSANPISTYLKNPFRYELKTPYFSYIKNKQSEDLGLGWAQYFVPSKLQFYLQELTNDFSLVMLMEYFDESLLLLKRKLCWNLKDILYIQKNQNKLKPNRNFTEIDHTRHRKISHLDYKLYDHFSQVFMTELRKQGADFYDELAHFKHTLKRVVYVCTSSSATFKMNATRWDGAFEVTRQDCELMKMDELTVLDLLLKRTGVEDKSKNKKRGRFIEAKNMKYLPQAWKIGITVSRPTPS